MAAATRGCESSQKGCRFSRTQIKLGIYKVVYMYVIML